MSACQPYEFVCRGVDELLANPHCKVYQPGEPTPPGQPTARYQSLSECDRQCYGRYGYYDLPDREGPGLRSPAVETFGFLGNR